MQSHLQRSVADLAIVVPVKEVERFLGFSYLGRDYDDDGGNSEYDDYVRWTMTDGDNDSDDNDDDGG